MQSSGWTNDYRTLSKTCSRTETMRSKRKETDRFMKACHKDRRQKDKKAEIWNIGLTQLYSI